MTDEQTEAMTIKEKADAEAARAEAEEPETETGEEPAGEPDADEAAEEEEQPTEPEAKVRRGKSPQERFQAAFAAFVKKAAECFEVLPADVQVAPHPGVVGIMLPGYAEPRTHDNYRMCTTCNGLGQVLTQAQTGKQENDWHVCPDTRCKGRGYWEKASAVAQPPATGPLAVQPPPTENGEFADAPAWLGDPSLTPTS